jgi:hypothetical protein
MAASFRPSVAEALGAVICVGLGVALAVHLTGDSPRAEPESSRSEAVAALAARMNAPKRPPEAALIVGAHVAQLPRLWSWWRRRGNPDRGHEPGPPRWRLAQKARRPGPNPRLAVQSRQAPLRIVIATSSSPDFSHNRNFRVVIAVPSAKALGIAGATYTGPEKPLVISRCAFSGHASYCLKLPVRRLRRYCVVSAYWRTFFPGGKEGSSSVTEWAIEILP